MSQSYDEMVTGTGALRPHWRELIGAVSSLEPAHLAERMTRVAARIGDDETIAHAGPNAPSHSRSLDLLPIILPESDWQAIASGLKQRARLLELILADLYGPQRLLEDHALPPFLVLGNPAFLRPLRHVAPVGEAPNIHFYAADLVRLPNGEWRVFADRTQAPGGVGYALHARAVLARIFPEAFRAIRVLRLDGFIEAWRASLRSVGAGLASSPEIVLLTPGPYNPAYFEHVLLARALGVTLVQSADLTIRNDHLYLKTLEGLVKVDVVYRRLDGDYCDSLELREESALGVPGLVELARRGRVAILNMPGSAVVETPAFTPFLPRLARALLGEELRLPAVTTWWCGQQAALDEVTDAFDAFALHPVFDPDPVPIEPALLSAADRAAFEAQLRRHPERFVARQRMEPSVVPCLRPPEAPGGRQSFVPEPVVLRVMAVWHGGDWTVLPGGMARIVSDGSIYLNRLHVGGIVKDVWIPAEQNADADAPAAESLEKGVLPARRHAALRSRGADDLYWLGRYAERLDSGARLFLATVARLASGGLGARERAELARLADALKRTGWIGFAAAAMPVDGAAFLQSVSAAAASGVAMRNCIDAIGRLTLGVRDQLSADMWRTLDGLVGAATATVAEAPSGPDRLLDHLSSLVAALAAFAGLAAENMVRGPGWRFLDLGRRIERGIAIAQAMRGVMSGPPAQVEAGYRLALELCDSVSGYLLRYPAETQYARALEFVLADRDNPRSLVFQLAATETHLEAMASLGPARFETAGVSALVAAIEALRPGPIDGGSGEAAVPALLDRAARELMEVSDALARAFFTHTAASPLTGFPSRPLAAHMAV